MIAMDATVFRYDRTTTRLSYNCPRCLSMNLLSGTYDKDVVVVTTGCNCCQQVVRVRGFHALFQPETFPISVHEFVLRRLDDVVTEVIRG